MWRALSPKSPHILQGIRPFRSVKAFQEVSVKSPVIWRLSYKQYRGVHDSETDHSGQWRTVYEGPISKSVKYVKLLSLTTAATMLIVAPLTIFFGKQAASLPLKVCLVTFLCSMGCGSTGLLHWVSKPYVRRMEFDPKGKRFSVETLSLFASTKRAEFSIDDITVYHDDRAFSTFEAHGVKYFIHRELVEAQQILHFIEQWKAGEDTSTQLDVKEIG
ncbi:uncharacterized protein [Montipora foliosa]|uniref:uncharacterized protein n=1 Tax=Montipora foliosa TaxID=591990 RepID=UPI0035F1EE56